MWSKAYEGAGGHFSEHTEHPHVSITGRQQARDKETKFFLSPVTLVTGCSLSQETRRDCIYSPGHSESRCLHMARAPLSLAPRLSTPKLGDVVKGSGLVTESPVDQRGAYVLLGDVALLLGVVLLLLPVLLFQQLGQRLQGLGAPQRGPLGVAGVVLNEVNALALHLDLEEERGRQQGPARHTHTGSCPCPRKGQSKEAPTQDRELQVYRSRTGIPSAHPTSGVRATGRSYSRVLRRNQCQNKCWKPLGCQGLPGTKS